MIRPNSAIANIGSRSRISTIVLTLLGVTLRRSPLTATGFTQLSPGAFSSLIVGSNNNNMSTSLSTTTTTTAGSSSSSDGSNVVDSHLHVWGTPSQADDEFPYSQAPPDALSETATTDALLQRMADAHVDGCLVVQPINYGYDHSYVTAAIQRHPAQLKGMLLYDPTRPLTESLAQLEELRSVGYVGVRFNPYLFPATAEEGVPSRRMYDGPHGTREYFQRCGELGMPVGIMCFQGLDLHVRDMTALLDEAPATTVVLDHFGFTFLNGAQGDANFNTLLRTCKQYPNLVVKVSALFRIAPAGAAPDLEAVRRHRFVPLLEQLGADRLMFGTDFPFVLDTEQGYQGTADLVRSWIDDDKDRAMVMGGTAERIFGRWGTVI